MELMRMCKWSRWKNEGWGGECRQRGGRGEGGGKEKPFGIMYQVYTEHLRPAGFLSHYGNSPVRRRLWRSLFTNCMLHENMADMSVKSNTEENQQLLEMLQFIVWVFWQFQWKGSRFLKGDISLKTHFILNFMSSYRKMCSVFCCWENVSSKTHWRGKRRKGACELSVMDQIANCYKRYSWNLAQNYVIKFHLLLSYLMIFSICRFN